MRVLSLFSGIGGLDLGLERAGMTVVAQSEIDPYACRVLRKHWPDVPNLGDITAITEADLEPIGPIDLVCGGPPCQPVSVAGKQLGTADDRWLWPEFDRVIGLVRPRYVLVENVPGLLGRGMDDVLGDLSARGYDATWTRLGACHVGAPHRRLRIFIVAWRAADTVRADVRDESGRRNGESGPGAPVAGHDGEAVVAADAIDPGPRRGGARRDRSAETACGDGRAVADDGTAPPDCGAFADANGREEGAGLEARRSAGNRRPGSGGARGTGDAPDAFGDRLQGLLSPGTETGAALGDRDGFWRDFPQAQPCFRDRDARLSGRVAKLKALGNSIVPQVAEHVGRCILAALNEQPMALDVAS